MTVPPDMAGRCTGTQEPCDSAPAPTGPCGGLRPVVRRSSEGPPHRTGAYRVTKLSAAKAAHGGKVDSAVGESTAPETSEKP
ncbi:hypothetical protein GCM10027073_49600 [Streptomyces chlorus]